MSVDRSQIVNILHEAVTNPNMPFMGDNREQLINELRNLQRVIACGSILIEQAILSAGTALEQQLTFSRSLRD